MEQLYDHYSSFVYGIAFNMTKSETASEKILKETFLHAWKYRSTFNPEIQPASLWLLGITRRIAHSQISFDEFMKIHSGKDYVSEASESDAKNEDRDLLTTVNKATLQKKIFELVFIGGGKINEVAKHLSMNESEVKQVLREAVSQNRKEFQKA